MSLTRLFVPAADAGHGLPRAGRPGRDDRRDDAGRAAVPQHRRAVDPGAGQLSGRFDDRDARRDRASARRPARRLAQPRPSRDLDPARAGVDRRRLPARLRHQTTISCRCKAGCRTRSTRCPTTCTTPQISLYNPAEAIVVSLVLRSRSLAPGTSPRSRSTRSCRRSSRSRRLVRADERDRHAGDPGRVDPHSLSASGFTLTDMVSAITNNNVRSPGGILYSPNRETNLDVRGDIQRRPDRAGLLLGTSAGATAPGRPIRGRPAAPACASATSRT